MRLAVYGALLTLALVAVLHGQLAAALAIGGAKAALVGIEYMELRRAARAHAIGFVLGVLAVTAVLVALVA